MSKGSKRPGWRVVRDRFNRYTRELAALSAAAESPPVQGPALPPLPTRSMKAKRQAVPRKRREMTERERAIRQWYLYGGVDDEPPAGLTDQELMAVRTRWCV